MHRCRGTSLMEVLVTVVVLSVGLLGLAGLQAGSQRNAHHAYLRGQAVALAYDILDRMRANPAGVQAGAYDQISGPVSDPGCIQAGCTPAQLAQHDAYQWQQQVASLLPGGQASVSRSGGRFRVQVAWDEKGATLPGCPAGLMCLSLEAQP
ncbi:MAG: type IV pilus modification protein PilV [Gammaproteobacteria bacterium]|nr:MAG: type IV pilus modification protein PilV [Gammaproteobacteria bacterium]